MFSDIRPNQRYVYALSLLGGHVKSTDLRLPKVGLSPGVLPAMDFLLVVAERPGVKYQYGLIRASQVDQDGSLAQIEAFAEALENDLRLNPR